MFFCFFPNGNIGHHRTSSSFFRCFFDKNFYSVSRYYTSLRLTTFKTIYFFYDFSRQRCSLSFGFCSLSDSFYLSTRTFCKFNDFFCSLTWLLLLTEMFVTCWRYGTLNLSLFGCFFKFSFFRFQRPVRKRQLLGPDLGWSGKRKDRVL